MTVVLGDASVAVLRGEEEILYDFNARRIAQLDRRLRTFRFRSLFGDIGFRSAELGNRVALAKALNSTKAGGLFELFEIESALSLEPPAGGDRPGPPEIVAKRAGDVFTFHHGKDMVVRFQASDRRTTGSLGKALARLLTHLCSIHPAILRRLEEVGKFPALLHYRFQDMGQRNEVTWRLKTIATQAQEESPAPEGFHEAAADDELDRVIALQEAPGARPPSREEALAFAREAAARGEGFDGLLAVLEFGMQSGEDTEAEIKELRPAAASDPRLRYLRLDLSSPAEARESFAALNKIDAARLKKGHVLAVFRSNAKAAMGDREAAVRFMLEALRHNPFNAGAWSDLGHAYYALYDMDKAWECWDAGRRASPHHPAFQSVDELEQGLLNAHPEYF